MGEPKPKKHEKKQKASEAKAKPDRPKHKAASKPKKHEKKQNASEAKAKPDRPKHKAEPKPKVRRYAVLRIVDGDTVGVGYKGGVSVRIIGIDTPETVSPSVADECWGGVASAAAANLLAGKQVSLTFDPSQGRTDYYGRTLGYLGIPGVGDFGLAMITRGHAAEYTYDSAYQKQSPYQSAERKAQAANRGLWGKCGGPDKPLNKPEPQPKPQTQAGNRAPGYDPCIPPYPPDLDCADVDGPIYVTGSDPHGLDAEGDGVGCES